MAPSTVLQVRRAGQNPSALGILGQFKRDRCYAPDCGPPSHAGQPVDLVQLVSDSKCGPQSVLGRRRHRGILPEVRARAVVDVDRAFRRRRKACTSESPESLYLRKTSGRSLGSLSIPIALPANPSNIER